MWREAAEAQFEAPTQFLPGQSEENHKILSGQLTFRLRFPYETNTQI